MDCKDKPSIIKPKKPSTIDTSASIAISMAATFTATFRPSFVPLVIASTEPSYSFSSSLFLMLGVTSVDGYIISAYIIAAGIERIEAVRKCWTTLMP